MKGEIFIKSAFSLVCGHSLYRYDNIVDVFSTITTVQAVGKA